MHDIHRIVDDWSITTDGESLRVEGASKLDSSTRSYIKSHKPEIIRFLQQEPVEPRLHPCVLCRGREFIHGFNGGYFCQICQPNVRPGLPVLAGSQEILYLSEVSKFE